MSGKTPRWLATHEEDGEPRFRVGRLGDDLVAEWCGRARVIASPDGERVEIAFEDGISQLERRKLELGGAKLLIHQLRGNLALHGSAVAFGDRAVVIVGGSGDGKSTLAAALCGAGGALLADDAVAIEQSVDGRALVATTEAHHWLDDAACGAVGFVPQLGAGDKSAVPAKRVAEGALPVAAVVALVWRDEQSAGTRTELTRVSGAAALGYVLPNVVRLVVDDPALNRAELDGLHSLVEHVPVHVLERRRDFDQLPAAVDMVSRLCFKSDEDHR